LQLQGATVRFGAGHGAVTAADRVDLDVPDGAVMGLVGESGSGKSSIAKAVVGLAPLVGGRVLLDGEPMRVAGQRSDRRMRVRQLRVQMVFQDPFASLDPRRSIGASIAEGVEAVTSGGHRTRASIRSEVRRLLDLVRLDPDRAGLLPRQLSGGQRQRVAIARALAARPTVLIADEITSALDVSVQGATLNLLRDIQSELGISVLFISHNLAVVRYLASSIAVMYCGQVVEAGSVDTITGAPQHPYTDALLRSVPSVHTAGGGTPDGAEPDLGALTVEADPPDPQHPPTGCRFHPRCPIGPAVRDDREICATADPFADRAQRPHGAACFFAGEWARTS
jgi:peptide/nickel transport system ATP-binding protein